MKNVKCVIRTDQKRSDNTHLIYLRYTYNRKFILFKIDDNLSVSKANWNAKIGRVRKSDNYEQINRILSKRENELVAKILKLIEEDKEPKLANVRTEFFKARNTYSLQSKPKKEDEKRFLNDFQDFISDKKEKDKVSIETIKTYKTTLAKLKSFQQEMNYPLHYDTITSDFYFTFLKYLRGGFSTDKKKKALFDNSVDKHIKNLKLFMNYSLEKEKHNNNIFHTFKRTRTKADFVVLDRNEIVKLYYEYKPKDKVKEKIRDTFIFGCATGLRYSDLSTLTRGNFIINRDPLTQEISKDVRDSHIKVDIKKTKQILIIPINNFIIDMINKYHIESNEINFLNHNIQVFNREIKSICRDAGIIEPIKISKKLNKQAIQTERAKCDFISSHTMRRTFITLLASMTQISNIQAVSGHRDIKILSDYVKRNDKELNTISGCFEDVFYKDEKEQLQQQKPRVNILNSTLLKS